MSMRRWISVVEAITPRGAYYMHVSPGKNINSILAHGLVAREEGNYSGYEIALPGIYATRMPHIIADHIFNRSIQKHYALMVVRVGTTVLIDEDVVDQYLHEAFKKVMEGQPDSVKYAMGFSQTPPEDDEDDWDEDIYADLAKGMVPVLLPHLGAPDPKMRRGLNAFLIEYCETWIRERIEGGESGADSDWWQRAKDRLVRSFPHLSDPQHGQDYSLRIPEMAVGYEGETRIVAVIEVKNNQAKVVKGALPPEAKAMVDDVVGDRW